MAHNKLRTFHLFAGAGGGILADLLLGHLPVGACEIEPYPRNVLLQRQRDGILPKFPIWDDICTLDGKPWRGSVNVLCGGFPCQDISSAGKGAGITGRRSGLWKEYARLIGEMRPRLVFAENSPLLRTRGLGVVLEDLAALGYNARWGVLGARDVGAPHKRDRMWVFAYAGAERCAQGFKNVEECKAKPPYGASGQPRKMAHATDLFSNVCDNNARISPQPKQAPQPANRGGTQDVSYAASERQPEQGVHGGCLSSTPNQDWKAGWSIDPGERDEAERNAIPHVDRVVDGVAYRVDRLKAIGNGQVPQCAAMAFNILSEGLI